MIHINIAFLLPVLEYTVIYLKFCQFLSLDSGLTPYTIVTSIRLNKSIYHNDTAQQIFKHFYGWLVVNLNIKCLSHCPFWAPN